MINRQKEIAQRNSAIPQPHQHVDFSKIKVGLNTLNDAVYALGTLRKANSQYSNKEYVLDQLNKGNLEELRNISNFYFRVSGIYSRLCRYLAYLYNYDWMITPYFNEQEKTNQKIRDAATEAFKESLKFLDAFEVKRFFGEVALKVIRNGAYYGYLVDETGGKLAVQELKPKYCRQRYTVNGRPAVEFNMKFFDDEFKDVTQREKILNLMPSEFKRGYRLYKSGKNQPDYQGDDAGWWLLDIDKTIKFNLNGEDYPMLLQVVPAIIDLDEAQALDRKRMEQKLLKLVIQKLPLDKNGELLFDIDEGRELHNMAVQMLSKAIGIDVLTTFADVEVADVADKSNTTSTDELMKVERAVYNEAGISQKQFNTDNSVALQKSILNDEASLYNLISQFESFLNSLIDRFSKKGKKNFYLRVQVLKTTIYNYQELAKLYKEQTQLGYSKMLPQIALGQSQSSILANAYFENDVLDLVSVFVPPMSSNTMNAESLTNLQGKDKTQQTTPQNNKENTGGRPEKNLDEKSEKTVKNIESAG